MLYRLVYYWRCLRDTVWHYYQDDMPRMAAAMSFYLLMALPATLLLLTMAIDNVIGSELVQEQIRQGLLTTFDATSTATILNIADNIRQRSYPNFWFTSIAIISAIVSATGASAQLHYSLNRIWGVRPKRAAWSNTIFQWVKSRLLAILFFALVLSLALVGLLASSVLNIFYDFILNYISFGKYNMLHFINFCISYVLYFFVFAVIFKYIPDVVLSWRDIALGTLLTTVLFGIGRYLIGWYIAQTTAFSPYGVSSSLVLLLTWVFYSLQITFLGGEFIKTTFLLNKRAIVPRWYAEKIPQLDNKQET